MRLSRGGVWRQSPAYFVTNVPEAQQGAFRPIINVTIGAQWPSEPPFYSHALLLPAAVVSRVTSLESSMRKMRASPEAWDSCASLAVVTWLLSPCPPSCPYVTSVLLAREHSSQE